MTSARAIMVCAALLLALIFTWAAGALAFNVPERLEFEIKWTVMSIGTGVMEFKKNDLGTYSIYMFAWSNDSIASLYPVQDAAESRLTDEKTLSSSKYLLATSEGKRKKSREIVFMRKERKAESIDHLKNERSLHDMPERIFDPLSGFMSARRMNLEVGKMVKVPVFDGKNVIDVDVHVLRREKVTVPAGEFDAIVIKPVIGSEGIFSKLGDMYIWLTDDHRKVPVKVKTKVLIGSVTADLTGGSY